MQDICSLGREARIVLMNGGLGNQMCQYFFLRWLEIKTGKECLASDYEFCIDNPAHNGYELERLFHIKVNRLSEKIPPDIWQNMMKKYLHDKIGICQQLLDMGYPVTMLTEYDDFVFNGNLIYMNGYMPLLELARGFLYFNGYWIHDKYFQDIKDYLLKEICFPPLVGDKNLKMSVLMKSTNSVCVHIRRGDFITANITLPNEIYKKAVGLLEQRESSMVYFVFSDDIPWCKENRHALGLSGKEVIFVEGNKGEHAYMDMQLMTMCKHRIVSNSSFSYLAAVLREDRDGMIVNLFPSRTIS
ncbi:alpha-1,2-fucosyltransferase [Selenomonas ruminantium]|uniref:Glycosyl transferase family 11 n=1 Tax=Selenomonas ruminantium TaxID=971 RepID=A0A1I0YF23_SELRU|nr:alpha-1,2-fucosyltransferase [Selenomonas ruminantium]SFB11995.1 Glycosyl transferase family 11 [Selenomonas ruminantium]